jgi:hypothetical protein
MVDDRKSEEGKDLCPMCNGTGTHDLKPPDRLIYRTVVQGPAPSTVQPGQLMIDVEGFSKQMSDFAQLGYEVENIFQIGSRAALPYLCAIMRWRWR